MDKNINSQLILSGKDKRSAQMRNTVNKKQEMLIKQTINEGIVQEELDIMNEEFISPDENNNQALVEDVNIPPIVVSSTKRRRSTEFVNEHELVNIRLKAAKLEHQINFLRMRVKNEKQGHDLILKIMLNEFNIQSSINIQ